jgi:large subunit ribosomal protein L18
MAKGARYRVQLRRRREGKTDYQARTGMVVSGRPRLVTRPSIKNIYAQIVIAKIHGDQTVVAASSNELAKKFGWKAPTGNIPAAYLTGLLCGLKAKAAGIDEAILDLGLINPTKGARVFAILYGVIDAGVEIPHGEEKIVKERAKGDHIARYAKNLNGEDPEAYQAKFSKYNAAGVAPEKVAAHFSEVRAAIVASFKGAKVAPEPPSAPEPKAKPKPQPPAPKAEAKAAEAKPAAPAPKPEAKIEAPKTEVKGEAPKALAKPVKEAPKIDAKTAKEKSPAAEEDTLKASKIKAKTAPKIAQEEAPKAAKGKAAKAEKAEKTQKEKAPAKGKAPAKKATTKGEKNE